jgi:diguanylate cyclase (GGDEF)-like protein
VICLPACLFLRLEILAKLVKNGAGSRSVIQTLTHRFQPQQFLRALAFLACGALISSLGISAIGPGPVIAALLCTAWAITGVCLRIPGALAVLLFTAIHLPGGMTVALICLGVAVVAVVLDIVMEPDSSRPDKLRALRNELRDAEFQQETLQRHIGRYPILLDSCTLFSNAQELGQLASMLCEQSRKIISDYSTIGVFFGKGDKISCAHAVDAQQQSINLDVDQNVVFGIAESRLLVLRDGTMNRVYVPLRGERRQEIAHLGHGVNGVLYISFQSHGIDDELLIDILRALGRLAGLTLASVNIMGQARDLALQDDLTGLYGRHEYERRLNEQIALCRRNKRVLGLIMCDMDHLKKFNDTYGHPVGDTALKAIAKSISEQIPEDGVACRFGGEEFSAFVVADNKQAVELLAHDIHRSIGNTKLDVDTSLTASIGWSILLKDDTEKEIIERADNACYQAKDSGRDKVVEAKHVAN